MPASVAFLRWSVVAPAVALVLAGLPTPPVARAEVPVAADPLDADAGETAPRSFPDPLERMNRLTFDFNEHVGRWVIDPMIRAYDFVVPQAGRRAIRRALANLDSPAVFANDVLQLAPLDAGVTASRFAINTTIGLLGFLDAAEHLGLPGHESDFGQTLALLGTPSGPYLILPVVGPTTARDGTGYLVDFLFRPTTYLLTPGTQLLLTPITEGGTGIVLYDANATAVHALEASSIDFYAAVKNAFYQDRTARIWARRDGPHPIVLAARWALRSRPLPASRGEVGDLPADRPHEPVEAVALKR